ARVLLDREDQLWYGGLETPADKMRRADNVGRERGPSTRAETQRGFDVLDCRFGLARQQTEKAFDEPAARVVRVECQCAVNQRHHGADVLAERGQRIGGICQDPWVVAGLLQGSPGEIGALQTVRRRIFAPTVLNL